MKTDIHFVKNAEDIFDSEVLTELPLEERYIMFFDQSTTYSGMSIFTTGGELRAYGLLYREKEEQYIPYKVAFKRYIANILQTREVEGIVYEEVYGSTFQATLMLNSIQTSFEELKAELDLDIFVEGRPNQTWKKRLVYPDKVASGGSKEEKQQVREAVLKHYPTLTGRSDIFDAVGIGLSYFREKNDAIIAKILVKKKKPSRNFKVVYELVYTGDISEGFINRIVLENRALAHDINKKGLSIFEYDTSAKLLPNLQCALEEVQGAVVTVIPDHRYFGAILLAHNIKYDKDKALLCFATR